MNQEAIPPALQQLIDRQEIHDCILRYCSGVDRFDREMLLSVYDPDAMADHGAFVGPVTEFVDWAFAYHAKYPYAATGVASRDKSDPSYQRPLTITRERQALPF